MKYVIILFVVIIVSISILVYFVSNAPKSNNKAAEIYFKHMGSTDKSTAVDDPILNFKSLFTDFKLGANEQIIRKTYADTFYFNDTFKIITSINELIPYMEETANLTKSTTIEVLDVAFSGTDYYVRWVMDMKLEVKNEDIYSRSIGMTQLRLDEEGKIIFHQDFWDSAEGFYQHLPYIGYVLRKVKSKI